MSNLKTFTLDDDFEDASCGRKYFLGLKRLFFNLSVHETSKNMGYLERHYEQIIHYFHHPTLSLIKNVYILFFQIFAFFELSWLELSQKGQYDSPPTTVFEGEKFKKNEKIYIKF